MEKKKWLIWIVAVVAAVALALTTVWLCLWQATSPEWPSASSTPAPSAPVIATTSTDVTTTTTASSATSTTTTTTAQRQLVITSHSSRHTTTKEPITVFIGTSDPAHPLQINGKTVERDASGAFSVEFSLKVGENTFTFAHKGVETTYVVEYDYVVMQSFSPAGSRRLRSGATLGVVVSARAGSKVQAVFRGETISLKATQVQEDEDQKEGTAFVNYSGQFTLPSGNTKDLSLGKVKFIATYQGQTDIGYSGEMVCEKVQLPTVAEIVAFSAETFSGNTQDDDSRPTNNYLPEGTVDYVVGRTYFGEKEYLKLRCGRRVYVSKDNGPGCPRVTVTKEYAGTLPDTNRLAVAGVEVSERFTTLTLDTQWKAPFLLDLLPQTYTDPKNQIYTVSKVTCTYVEIRFCYASALTGQIHFDAAHPLFTRAEVLPGEDCTVLRLYLRRTGGFYGWDATYNEAGQLVFQFLHPVQVTQANNTYGADLTGVTVMLDVGHGGSKSPGTVGSDSRYPESERNLYLAGLLRKELESMGATVVLNRTGDTLLDNDTRCKLLKQLKPDLCIAIHHDGNLSSRPNGFGSFHSTLFSREAARYIYEATMEAHIYDASAPGNRNRFEWHYYFVARMSDCPVVLTENGFMTNRADYTGIVSASVNRKKAQAIAQGVADYFLSIRLPDLPPPTTTTTTTTTTTSTTEATTTTTEAEITATGAPVTTTTALPPEEE